MDFIVNHKKAIKITGVIIVSVLITLTIIKIAISLPVNLHKTDLSKASQSTIDKAADQMTITIADMPSDIDEETEVFLSNQLANILRQKYGSKSIDYTAKVRAVAGYTTTGGVEIYVDVPEANETYVSTVNLENHIGSFSCAPPDQQMSPDSQCEDLLSPDINIFPNG